MFISKLVLKILRLSRSSKGKEYYYMTTDQSSVAGRSLTLCRSNKVRNPDVCRRN